MKKITKAAIVGGLTVITFGLYALIRINKNKFDDSMFDYEIDPDENYGMAYFVNMSDALKELPIHVLDKLSKIREKMESTETRFIHYNEKGDYIDAFSIDLNRPVRIHLGLDGCKPIILTRPED